MAHIDLEHSGTKTGAFATSQGGLEVSRTKYMLAITTIASVGIIVVAALFMSLF